MTIELQKLINFYHDFEAVFNQTTIWDDDELNEAWGLLENVLLEKIKNAEIKTQEDKLAKLEFVIYCTTINAQTLDGLKLDNLDGFNRCAYNILKQIKEYELKGGAQQ